MRRFVRAARAWLAGPTPPPPESYDRWLRDGVPRPLMVLAALLAALCWSGPLRAITRASMPLALVYAVLLTLGFAAPLWPSLRRPQPRGWAWAAALAATAALVPALLYDRWFGGLTVIVDGDSGGHVSLRDQFVHFNPGAYQGFCSFYALTHWIERLHADTYVSFAVAFYVSALVYALAPLAAAGVVLAPAPRRAGFVAAVAGNALLLYFVALPLFHYHQSEGFFVHVFAIGALLALWLADAMVRPPRLRLVFLGAGVVAYRYSYGLNLGDLLVAVAVDCLCDTRRLFARRGGRLAIVALAAALCAAAYVAYGALAPLWIHDGWIIAHDQRRALAAQWLLIAAELAALLLPWTRRRLAGRGLMRWLRLPLAFGTVNALMLTRMTLHPPPTHYYFVKYGLHAVWLLAAATIPLVAALAAGPVDAAARAPGRRPLVAGALVAAALAGGLVLMTQSIAVYRAGFLERAFGRPPFKELKPLADLAAWRRIDRVLAREHKQFGGYLTTWYPLMNFMNASFGFFNEGINFYWGRAPLEGPGYCDFWEGGPQKSWFEPSFPQDGRRARWERDPLKQCVSYRAHWNPALVRTLCWICR